jgi:hypothetical protein
MPVATGLATNLTRPMSAYPVEPDGRSDAKSRWHANPNSEPMREIYFVQAERLGLIKIGQTRCAASRLKHLQTHSPDRLYLLGYAICERSGELEIELHHHFADLRSHGVWYRPESPLLCAIEKLTATTKARETSMVLSGLGGPRHVFCTRTLWELLDLLDPYQRRSKRRQKHAPTGVA